MKIDKLGILTPDLGYSQLTFQLITGVNSALADNKFLDICVFIENVVQFSWYPNFPIMTTYYAYSYPYQLFATSLTTAKKLIEFPLCKNKVFYIWDMEWTQIKDKEYDEIASIYKDPNLELVARSTNHAKYIEKCWDRPVSHIVEDFNIIDLMKVTSNGEK